MKLAAKVLGSPAEEHTIRSLERLIPEGCPEDYISVLRLHNGAEFSFRDVDWHSDRFDSLRVFSAEEMIRLRNERWLPHALPTLLVIGTDSGGQFLAYDMRKPRPWPLVIFTPGCHESVAYTHLADSLSELITA